MKTAIHVIAKDQVEDVQRIYRDYGKYVDKVYVAYDDEEAFKDLVTLVEKSHEQGRLTDLYLIKYEWIDHFAHKRNFLVEHMDCDYYLRLDTDDILINPEELPLAFKKAKEKGVNIVHCEYLYSHDADGNCNVKHWRETIIQKTKELYWEKPVHENMYAPNPQNMKAVADESIKILHNTKEDHTETSSARNFRILIKEWEKDKEGCDPRTVSYIGRMLMGAGKWKEAISFLRQFVEKSGWPDDKYFGFVHLSHCFKSLGDMTSAISCCNEALAINPEFPDAYLALGEIYMGKGEFEKAVSWLRFINTNLKPTYSLLKLTLPHIYFT
jgi:tetratricopeptide (TPR) repeat protein